MRQMRICYKFILHFITARHTRGHGVHSPFLYQFTKFVLLEKNSFYIFSTIERIRFSLKKDKRILNIKDFGVGSDRSRTIADIATHDLKSARYGQLLFRMVNYFKATNVLELGTSLGVTTAYLASSSTDIKCVSLEGCPQIASVASENLKKIGLENVKVVVGNIDITLTQVLNDTEKLDFIFLDANHRSEAVLNYFEQCLPKVHENTLMVIDDIYWSTDMEKAWQVVKQHSNVTSTIDLFQMGLVFFNKNLHKTHYKMRY